MNQAHFHLLINHIPILFPIVGILLFVGALVFKSAAVKQAALAVFICGALATFPAMYTGEGAEDVVENLPGVTEQIIETHEETAETFAFMSYALGVISLLGLWAGWQQKSFAPVLSYAILAFSLVVVFFASRTGLSGGEIRHTEIRNDAPLSPADAVAPEED